MSLAIPRPRAVRVDIRGAPVYFIHVPRAGGRSVARWFGLNDYAPYHRPATEVMAGTPAGAWCFGVLRDPHERLVSELAFRLGREPTVAEFRDLSPKVAHTLSPYPAWAARLLLDHRACAIVRFSHLESDIRALCEARGIEAPEGPLPHVREHPPALEGLHEGYGPDPVIERPTAGFYTPELIEMVARLFPWDLQRLHQIEEAA